MRRKIEGEKIFGHADMHIEIMFEDLITTAGIRPEKLQTSHKSTENVHVRK